MSTREAHREQIENLALSNRELRTVLELLRSTPTSTSKHITEKIREAATLDEAVSLIADASVLLPYGPDPASISPNPLRLRFPDLVQAVAQPWPLRCNGISVISSELPMSRWTSVVKDDRLLTHLLTLFWTWDQVVIRILNQVAFLEELYSNPDSDVQYCSRFLVNAILAVATLHLGEKDIHDSSIDARSLGRRFAGQAYRQFQTTERARPSLTVMQGLTFLWLFESVCGHKARATAVSRPLLELYDVVKTGHSTAPGERLLREWRDNPTVAWGFGCFGKRIGMALHRGLGATPIEYPARGILAASDMPDLSDLPTQTEDRPWVPYPISTQLRPSYSPEMLAAERSFLVLTEKVASAIENDDQGVISDASADDSSLHRLCDRVRDWKAQLPHHIQVNTGTLPSITHLMVAYELLMLRILSTFSTDNLDVRFSVYAAASSLITHLWTHRAAYGPRPDYWLAQACITATAIIFMGLPDSVRPPNDTVLRAMQLAREAADRLPAARGLLVGLRSRLRRAGIRLPNLWADMLSALEEGRAE
ncbi:hypothetical protein VTK73DRAFT_9422 [Phialemonium thermophilum]|uniref:Xylanolytic transcriptional activator regulatory domain-containing protein n=1 Tax=Phialemonium thermophilum TaxID=223376 RepID=A0ABR3W2B0_9PEZI